LGRFNSFRSNNKGLQGSSQDLRSSQNIGRKLSSILKNMQYFAESVARIDNIEERYVLLNQFTKDEMRLRAMNFGIEQAGGGE